MPLSRRELLKGGGALIISFAAGRASPLSAHAQGEFGTHPSHIDPNSLDSWIAIHGDGSVTACTGKCDFGQGILTAQAQLVAEELCVPIQQVHLIECDTAITPDQGTTSGSQSTPTNFNDENLALAAATARETLVAMAARKLDVAEATLVPQAGTVTAADGRSVTYAELIGDKRFQLGLSKTAKRRSPAQWVVLGKPVPSLDRQPLMTGTFEYVHHVRVPGMVHACVVRPPQMGARLLRADEGAAREIPGFLKLVVRQDFVGVIAETWYAAIAAARAVTTEWRPGPRLPPESTFFDHLQQQPSSKELSVDSGDVERQLAASHRRLHARYIFPYQMHGSVGSSCAVADVRDGAATVWSATQSAYPTRSCLAKLLDLPLDKVRVIYTRGSGCYGLNGADAVSFDAAVLSQAIGRPVRLQFSRQDEMQWENLGAACVVEHRAGLDAHGSVVAWNRENWVASLGNRPGYDQPGNVISGMLLGYDPEPFNPGPEKQATGKFRNQSNTIPAYLAGCVDGVCGGQGTVRSERVLTHTVASPFFTGPLRSPLRIQNTFANECFMDELCFAAGADPVAFRVQHLSDPRTIAVLKRAAEQAGWQGDASSSPLPGSDHLTSGRGVACVGYEGQNGYAAVVASVEVDRQSGVVRPTRFVLAIDCGPISNPDGLRNQVEGGILQGISRSLVEEVHWNEERITSVDWIDYRSLRLDLELPAIETVFVSPPGVRATGAGETAITLIPAAIGNAVFAATGARLRQVPFTPERMRSALHEAERTRARRHA